MASIYAREATLDDVAYIAERMRDADRLEVWQSHRLTPEIALHGSFRSSSRVWTGLTKEGAPCLMFGVSPQSLLSDVGVPWLLGTDELKSQWIEFLRHSKEYVAEMKEGFEVLENWVHADNKLSIRWLKWCGFHLEEAAPFGPDNALFHHFYLR